MPSLSDPNIWMSIVMQLPDAVVCTDTAGVITHWNAAAEKAFGHTAAEAIGQSLDLIIPEKLREPHWRGFRRAMEEGRTSHTGPARVTKAVTRSGEILYVETSFGVLKDESGRTIGASSVSRDVTERHRRAG